MGANFSDMALVENQDLIGMTDRRQTVSNDDTGSFSNQFFDSECLDQKQVRERKRSTVFVPSIG